MQSAQSTRAEKVTPVPVRLGPWLSGFPPSVPPPVWCKLHRTLLHVVGERGDFGEGGEEGRGLKAGGGVQED